MNPCDCFNRCGDDPDIAKGLATPCEDRLKAANKITLQLSRSDFESLQAVIDVQIATQRAKLKELESKLSTDQSMLILARNEYNTLADLRAKLVATN